MNVSNILGMERLIDCCVVALIDIHELLDGDYCSGNVQLVSNINETNIADIIIN